MSNNSSRRRSEAQPEKDPKNQNIISSKISNGEQSKPQNNQNQHQDSLEFEVIDDVSPEDRSKSRNSKSLCKDNKESFSSKSNEKGSLIRKSSTKILKSIITKNILKKKTIPLAVQQLSEENKRNSIKVIILILTFKQGRAERFLAGWIF